MNSNTAMVAALLLLSGGAARADDRDYDQKIAAEPNGSVEISNVAGSIDIIGWDRAEVAVKGELGEGVERVEFSGSRGRTYVKVVSHRSSQDPEARLTVSVPKGSEITASAVSADLDSKGVTGRQRLTSVSGEIRADVAADTQVKSVSGDIELRGTEQPANLRMSSVSGNVRLERGAGEVEASSISGDVDIEVDPAQSVRLHSTSGDLKFRGELQKAANLEAETVSGEVMLSARAKAGYGYEVSTFAGDIGNCFGKKAERSEAYGPGSRLNGTLGEGNARVLVKSMSGDVTLCDK